MLLKLMPDQVSRYWDLFKEAILETVPPIPNESPETLNNMLAALLAEGAQAWVSFRKEDNVNKVHGFIVTSIVYDPITNTRSLYIQSIYVPENNSIEQDWIEGMMALRKFAIANNCNRVLGHTKNKRLIEFAAKFGGNTDYVLCSWPLIPPEGML